MIYIMPSPSAPLFPPGAKLLRDLGERLRDARLRRRFSGALVASRAGLSRQTLTKIERGDPAVTLGSYMHALRVLGLESDLANLAADDVVGRRLQDEGLPGRARAPKRRRASIDSSTGDDPAA